MLSLRKYSALPSVLAALYFAVYAGWLQFSHGHDPLDYLSFTSRTPRVILEGVHCHNSVAPHPLFESHRLRLKPLTDCPLCTISNWQYFPFSGAVPGFEDLPLNLRSRPAEPVLDALITACYHLRAPPVILQLAA